MFVKEEALSWMCLVFCEVQTGAEKKAVTSVITAKGCSTVKHINFLPKSFLFSSVHPCLMPAFNLSLSGCPPAPLICFVISKCLSVTSQTHSQCLTGHQNVLGMLRQAGCHLPVTIAWCYFPDWIALAFSVMAELGLSALTDQQQSRRFRHHTAAFFVSFTIRFRLTGFINSD